jgi:hypothetical protein
VDEGNDCYANSLIQLRNITNSEHHERKLPRLRQRQRQIKRLCAVVDRQHATRDPLGVRPSFEPFPLTGGRGTVEDRAVSDTGGGDVRLGASWWRW